MKITARSGRNCFGCLHDSDAHGVVVNLTNALLRSLFLLGTQPRRDLPGHTFAQPLLPDPASLPSLQAFPTRSLFLHHVHLNPHLRLCF